MPDTAKVHQLVLEILAKFDGDLRNTQTVLEYVNRALAPEFRNSQTVIEIVNKAAAPRMRTSQVVIEVIRGGPELRRDIWYTDEAADSADWFAF